VLKRGYAIVQGVAGVVTSSKLLKPGEALKLSFAEGGAKAQVVEKWD
jgi:exonuclease VII large subunit